MPARESVDAQVAFAGCCNARDLGGLLAGTGRRIPSGRLFRADCIPARSLANADETGRMRPATVIDLRSDAEVRRAPAPTANRLHLPLDNPQRGMGPEDWQHPHAVAERYLALLLDGEESIAEILAVLTDPAAYPVVIHCSGGKDRTGIVVALVLALLGVADDDIAADYALSGFGAARLLMALQERVASPDRLRRVVPALLSTCPDNIGRFLDRVRTKFGSVEGYVSEIGMAPAIGYLRTALLT